MAIKFNIKALEDVDKDSVRSTRLWTRLTRVRGLCSTWMGFRSRKTLAL